MKLTVVGLDGAHWELIEPWIEDGSLPNIEKIIEFGVWTDMESCLPPVTFPNWKCYSTGKNPGKIGIFWWENIDFEQRRIYHPFFRKLGHREIWDYIGETGRKVGIIGIPGTYPVRKVNGFMIAGGPDAEEKEFTYPEKLEETIKENYGFRVRPHRLISPNTERGAREIQNIIDVKFKVAKVLAAEYRVDFLQVTSFEINTMHHFYWDDEKTKDCWKTIDSHIGDFVKDRDSNLILMSDHGSNEIETVFNINTWLERKGYLRTRAQSVGVPKFLHRAGFTQDKLLKLAQLLRLRGLTSKVPNTLVQRIPIESQGVEKQSSMIDWKRSKAIASGQGPLYLNAHDQQERDTLARELKEELEGLRKLGTDEKIVEKVYFREELYSGRYLDEAPDLVIDQARRVHIPGGIGTKEVFTSPRRWRAENKKLGLFAAYGPDIKQGGKIRNIQILDLAPTILHIFNIPIPKDMDGRILREIFHEQSSVAKRRNRYQKERERERIKQKVQELKKFGKI